MSKIKPITTNRPSWRIVYNKKIILSEISMFCFQCHQSWRTVLWSIVKPGPQHTLMEKTKGTLERTMASAVGNSHHITTQCQFCQSYNQGWNRTSILDTCRYTPQLNFSAIPFGPDTDWNHWFGTVTKVTAKAKEENVRNLKQGGQDMRFGPFFFVLHRLNA